MSAFHELNEGITGMLAEQGIIEPTLPQELAIPQILEGRTILLIAPTGTGKTEAAVLPIFDRILSGERSGIYAVYITPLRALNRDMLRRLQDWGKRLGISIAVRHGDTSKSDRRRQSLNPPDLLITTPETLQVMLTGKRLRANLSNIKVVVVDEVHELASSKRGSQLAVLLERLAEIAGEFQRVGLSATVGSPDEVARFLVGTTRSYGVIQADVERISDFLVVSPQPNATDCALAGMLETDPRLAAQIRWIRDKVREKKCLIFVNTRQAAEVLGSRLNQLGEPIGIHHGSLSAEVRIEAEENFKSGKLRGLICTSSMELGLDIGDVEHVIQYSSPREVSRLLQRVGRAGHRIGRRASGTIIATGPDDIAEACAISRRSAIHELERIDIHEKPADVIANQLVAMELDFGEISLQRAHQILTRAYPFRDLTIEELKNIAIQIEDHRLTRMQNENLQRTRRCREYLYENISMIPDEKRYNIYDIVGRKSVGTLDEAFVVSYANPGATFVTKGEIWEITEIEDAEIKVVPIQRSGEIPSWTGEEIPVPFEVAQDVGRIRNKIRMAFESGGEPAAVKFLLSNFPVDQEAATELVDLIRRQIDGNFPVPDDSLLMVECDGAESTINACLGHKTNDTLGRVLTAILSARFGSSVALERDPYRIELTLPKNFLAEEIAAMLTELNPDHIEPILEMTLKNTALLRWKMVHVARKFGALSKNVDYQKLSMTKLLGIFEGTPMYREALREIFQDRLDLKRAKEVLKSLGLGKISIITSGRSPIGVGGRGGGRDVMFPDQPDGAVIGLLKSRIMNDRVILFCVSCKKWRSLRTVSRVPERPECPLCGSKLIAALKPWEEEEIKVVKKPGTRKNAEDRRRTKRVYRNANLILSYGKTADIALASHGLGPETAARVVGKLQKDEQEFYRDIMKAEREYARTKRFWA
ncbi:MAG: DEAD/DEAH box helicase [Methanotrichaceae archaeon]|nr:DEAD/DEAH box helicase [Methanotrichaceae archaeon]